MARTLDDIYREILFDTGATTDELPYVYVGGGDYSFLQAFADVYKILCRAVADTDSDFFTDRITDDVTIDVEEYHFPNDLMRLRHIEFQLDGTNWYRGELIDPVFFRSGAEQSQVSAASESKPLFWPLGSINTPSTRFRIAPRPLRSVMDGIKLYYDRIPSALFSDHISAAVSAASAVVTFPGDWEHLIPKGVESRIWGKFGEETKKAESKAEFRDGIRDMKSSMSIGPRTGHSRIRDIRETGLRDGPTNR